MQHTTFQHFVGCVNSELVDCTVAQEDNAGSKTGVRRSMSGIMVRKPIDAILSRDLRWDEFNDGLSEV